MDSHQFQLYICWREWIPNHEPIPRYTLHVWNEQFFSSDCPNAILVIFILQELCMDIVARNKNSTIFPPYISSSCFYFFFVIIISQQLYGIYKCRMDKTGSLSRLYFVKSFRENGISSFSCVHTYIALRMHSSNRMGFYIILLLHAWEMNCDSFFFHLCFCKMFVIMEFCILFYFVYNREWTMYDLFMQNISGKLNK